MDQNNFARMIVESKQEGLRKLGRSKLMWMGWVYEGEDMNEL